MLNANRIENSKENITNIVVDDEGFLIDPEQWTEAFAANALGLLPPSVCPRHNNDFGGWLSSLRTTPTMGRVFSITETSISVWRIDAGR